MIPSRLYENIIAFIDGEFFSQPQVKRSWKQPNCTLTFSPRMKRDNVILMQGIALRRQILKV